MINCEVAGLDRSIRPDLILVNSPMRDYGLKPKDEYEVLPPLGLATIATQAATNGNNIGIIDAEHHGLGQTELEKIVNNLNPRWAGINILTPTRLQAQTFAQNLNPDIPLLIGGPHATAMPEKTLREISAVHPKTLLIRGEAEYAVTELLEGKNPHEIQGACWLEEEAFHFSPQVAQIPNINLLPQIDRRYLHNDPSVDHHTERIESRVLTSRGCSFNCTFCAGARDVSGLPVRFRDPQQVALETQGLINHHQVNSIRFVDDLFIASERRARSILTAMENAGSTSLWWDATGRANILAKFSPEFLDYLKAQGASEIAIGIESGSARLRKRVHKQVTIDEIEKSIKSLTAREIKVKGYFIIGLPTESRDETNSTLQLAKRLTQEYRGKFRASIFIFRPYPGTKEWSYLIEHGYNEDELLSMHADGEGERSKHGVLTTQHFGECTPQELSDYLAQYNAWQQNFI